MSKKSNNPDGFVTLRECSTVRIGIEKRLTRVEILVSIQIIMLAISLLKMFAG